MSSTRHSSFLATVHHYFVSKIKLQFGQAKPKSYYGLKAIKSAISGYFHQKWLFCFKKIGKLARKWHFLTNFVKNRASRKPYKALENLKSRDTALFTIFRYRGSSEPTEAFCLCLRAKFGLKTSKTGIFGAIFRVLGSNLCIFLFFYCNFKPKSYILHW